MNGFFRLFQLCFHIAHGHIPCVLGVAYLLIVTKPSGGVCPITMGETSLLKILSFATSHYATGM
jgi:hypothetical protein